MPRLDWLILYCDGSTHSSSEGPWAEAPGWGVALVLFRDPKHGWTMRHGADFYHLDRCGAVIGLDSIGLLDLIIETLGIAKVGRMISRAQWADLYQRGKGLLAEMKEADL